MTPTTNNHDSDPAHDDDPRRDPATDATHRANSDDSEVTSVADAAWLVGLRENARARGRSLADELADETDAAEPDAATSAPDDETTIAASGDAVAEVRAAVAAARAAPVEARLPVAADDDLGADPDEENDDSTATLLPPTPRPPAPLPPVPTRPSTPIDRDAISPTQPAGPTGRLEPPPPIPEPITQRAAVTRPSTSTERVVPRWEAPPRLQGSNAQAEPAVGARTDRSSASALDWRLGALALVAAVLLGVVIAAFFFGGSDDPSGPDDTGPPGTGSDISVEVDEPAAPDSEGS